MLLGSGGGSGGGGGGGGGDDGVSRRLFATRPASGCVLTPLREHWNEPNGILFAA